ncbi:Os10g0374700, partial [Oryza sativa Japonica Group]
DRPCSPPAPSRAAESGRRARLGECASPVGGFRPPGLPHPSALSWDDESLFLFRCPGVFRAFDPVGGSACRPRLSPGAAELDMDGNMTSWNGNDRWNYFLRASRNNSMLWRIKSIFVL